MRVLAFDPGFERLGAAVLEKNPPAGGVGKDVLLHSECIHTSPKLSFEERLLLLGKETEGLITKWQPDMVAIEDVYFENNAKTAMQVAEVCGMLKYIALSHGAPLTHYSPLQVKVAITGYGKSDKVAVAHMVARLVALPEKKRLDDEIDAIAVGLTCLASTRLPS
ncbi:MAG: crossover junction endodeoxyribonuclease RuvC [bacterium]